MVDLVAFYGILLCNVPAKENFVEPLIALLGGTVYLVFFVMMVLGIVCWPALFVYAIFSQSRSLRRIAAAMEHTAYDAPRAPVDPVAVRPEPVITRSPGIVGSAFGR
jgi:hypothetical protein